MSPTTNDDTILELVGPTKPEQPERSGYNENTDRLLPRTKQNYREDMMGYSNLVMGDKMHNVRYFIIKSLNYENIQLSVEKGIWATQLMNEPILEEAFNSSQMVILIFSVNSSGFFNGYAQMTSSVGQRRDRVWSQGSGANNSWGRSFNVKWLRLSNLPFYKTLHLKNPFNEYKPVKISRDCQELSTEVGEALCNLIDKEFDEDPNMMSGHDLEPGCSFPQETCNTSSNVMSWGATYMLHPCMLYQSQSEASRWHSAHHGSIGVSEEEFLEMTYEEYLEAHDRSTNQQCQHAGGQLRKREDSSSKEINSEDLYSNSDHVSSSKMSIH